MKNANKKRVFSLGNLNFISAFLMCLKEKTTNTLNKIGSNNINWCPIVPKNNKGFISNLLIELVLSEDWKAKEANSFWKFHHQTGKVTATDIIIPNHNHGEINNFLYLEEKIRKPRKPNEKQIDPMFLF